MLDDILTVMWKEWKELLTLKPGGRARGGVYNLIVVLVVFGVFLPLQSGREWVESPLVLVYWAWVPLFLVSGVIADSFAGERERHTLETLLASRLPEMAILLGKAATAVLYACGLTLASLLLGLITVNVTAGHGQLLLYRPGTAAGGLVLGLLAAGLAAGAGVLVSLRAPSVRQAAQTMSIAIMLLLFIPIFGFQALPMNVKATLVASLQGLSGPAALGTAALVLLVADAALLAAARARFQRARLVLD